MDPLILKYLGDKYSDEERSKVEEQAREEKNKLALLQAASGFGEALAGRAPSQSAQYFGGLRGDVDKNTIGKFDQGRKQALMDYDLKQKFQSDEMNQEKQKRMLDPNSIESQAYKQIGAKFGIPKEKLDKMNAAQIKEVSPLFGQIYDMDQRALSREDHRKDQMMMMGIRREDQQTQREEKKTEKAKPSEKQVELFTDFDKAESDLDDLLSVSYKGDILTGPLEGRVPELIASSEKNAFRTAVGKYKDAYRKAITGAGAGPREIALLETRLPSETDRPEDFQAKALEAKKTLERYRSISAQNMEKAGKNVSEFKQRAQASGPKVLVKKEKNDETGQTRLTYSDGSTEIIGGK